MKIFDKIFYNLGDKIQDSIFAGFFIHPPCFYSVVSWFTGTKTADKLKMEDSASHVGLFPLKMINGPCIAFDGIDSCTTATNHGTIESYEGTSTLAYDGANLTGTAGTFYNLLFSDGTLYPCIGKTSTLNPTSAFATNGSELVIISLDYVAIWAGSQDTYFYEANNGYYEDVSGRYPFFKSGSIKYHHGWNNPMNSFTFGDPVSTEVIAMDSVNLLFTDGVGNAKVLTQAEIEAGCNLNDQYFFGSSGLVVDSIGELLLYDQPLTDPCLGEVLVYIGLAEWVTDKDTGIVVTDKDTGYKVYWR